MATKGHRYRLLFLCLVAAAALSGCGKKWETIEFPEPGFAATFPMPVTSQPRDNSTLQHWAFAGDVQLQVVVGRMPGEAPTSAEADELLNAAYEKLLNAGHGRDESPPRAGQFQDKYKSIEFHVSGTTPDGKKVNRKGRIVIAKERMFLAMAMWPSGDKKGPLHADRFLDSFKIMQ